MRKDSVAVLLVATLILAGAAWSSPDKELRELQERVRRIEDSVGRTALQPIGPSIQRQLQELRDTTERLERAKTRLPNFDDDGRDLDRRFDAVDRSLSQQQRAIESLQTDRTGGDAIRDLQNRQRDLQRQLERLENRVRTLERRRP